MSRCPAPQPSGRNRQTAGWGPSKGARVLKPASIAPTPRDEGKWSRGLGERQPPCPLSPAHAPHWPRDCTWSPDLTGSSLIAWLFLGPQALPLLDVTAAIFEPPPGPSLPPTPGTGPGTPVLARTMTSPSTGGAKQGHGAGPAAPLSGLLLPTREDGKEVPSPQGEDTDGGGFPGPNDSLVLGSSAKRKETGLKPSSEA